MLTSNIYPLVDSHDQHLSSFRKWLVTRVMCCVDSADLLEGLLKSSILSFQTLQLCRFTAAESFQSCVLPYKLLSVLLRAVSCF